MRLGFYLYMSPFFKNVSPFFSTFWGEKIAPKNVEIVLKILKKIGKNIFENVLKKYLKKSEKKSKKLFLKKIFFSRYLKKRSLRSGVAKIKRKISKIIIFYHYVKTRTPYNIRGLMKGSRFCTKMMDFAS